MMLTRMPSTKFLDVKDITRGQPAARMRAPVQSPAHSAVSIDAVLTQARSLLRSPAQAKNVQSPAHSAVRIDAVLTEARSLLRSSPAQAKHDRDLSA